MPADACRPRRNITGRARCRQSTLAAPRADYSDALAAVPPPCPIPPPNRPPDPACRRAAVVVKVGSALLVDAATGRLNRAWLETLAEDLVRLRKRGQQVILVSSGAIALGRRHLGLPRGRCGWRRARPPPPSGQIRLAHAYKELLEDRRDHGRAGAADARGQRAAPPLPERARHAARRCWRWAPMPVINENDTVATAEIRYGDNDRLAARVAQMASADCLVLLSDVDGLYTADPNLDPEARIHRRGARHHAGDRGDGGRLRLRRGLGRHGDQDRGGAASRSARAATCASPRGITRIRCGASRTARAAPGSCRPRRRSRRASSGSPARCKPAGAIHIDAGAVDGAARAARACCRRASRGTQGRFERGDAVSVLSADGREVARGLAAYSDADAARIMGRRSAEIETLLGFRGRDEMIHRDDLVHAAGRERQERADGSVTDHRRS